MPRLKSRSTSLGALNGAQRAVLLYGDAILPPMPGESLFASDTEAAVAWRANRHALLAEFDQPGRRPWGYWRFDLGMPDAPMTWWQEAAELERLNLLSREEEIRLERTRRELAAEQGSLYEALFARQDWGGYMLSQFRDEFAFAAAWHRRRNRAALAEKYEKLAEQAKAILSK